jgi:hypothetical protein
MLRLDAARTAESAFSFKLLRRARRTLRTVAGLVGALAIGACSLDSGSGDDDRDEIDEGEVGTESSASVAGCPTLAITSVRANGEERPNVATNVLDGNYATRWSHLGPGAWIQADLGASRSVCGLSVAWHSGTTRRTRFTILASSDGTSFRQVYAGRSSGRSLALEPYAFSAPATARHLRLVVDRNTENAWASVTELRASGRAIASAPSPSPPEAGGLSWSTTFASGTPKSELGICVEDNPENLWFPTASYGVNGGKVMRIRMNGGTTTGYKAQSWFHSNPANPQTKTNLGLRQMRDATLEIREYIPAATHRAFDGVDVKSAGLAGVPDTKSAWQFSSGGVKQPDAWSVRLHYRKSRAGDGIVNVDAYIYAIRANGITYATNPIYSGTKYGISVPLTTTGSPSGPKIAVPADRAFTFKMRVKLNTPGRDDGTLQMWFDDALALNLHDVQWNSAEYNTPINVMTNGSWYNTSNTQPTTYLDHLKVAITGTPF